MNTKNLGKVIAGLKFENESLREQLNKAESILNEITSCDKRHSAGFIKDFIVSKYFEDKRWMR